MPLQEYEGESGDERALARALSDAFAAPCAEMSTPPPPLHIPDVDAPDSTPKKVEEATTTLFGLRCIPGLPADPRRQKQTSKDNNARYNNNISARTAYTCAPNC